MHTYILKQMHIHSTMRVITEKAVANSYYITSTGLAFQHMMNHYAE